MFSGERVAQENRGGQTAGAETGPGAGGPERGDQLPEEPGGRAGENHPYPGGRQRTAAHCEKRKYTLQTDTTSSEIVFVTCAEYNGCRLAFS